MKDAINQLIELSHYYGGNKDFILAGGGNTSFKDKDHLWIKASGTNLKDIAEEGFAKLDRNKLQQISIKEYSKTTTEREEEVKQDLYNSLTQESRGKRPSVETSLHNAINYSFIVHTHPTLVNGLMCSRKAKEITEELFGKDALFIEYTDPGYTLFKKVEKRIKEYQDTYHQEPKILFLENHGVFVSSDDPNEIKSLYDMIMQRIQSKIDALIQPEDLEIPREIKELIPAIRMLLSEDQLKTLRIRNNTLIQSFFSGTSSIEKISRPFTPDMIVYCKSNYLFINNTDQKDNIVSVVQDKIEAFRKKHHYDPKIIMIKGVGLISAGNNASTAETMLDVYEDLMKVSAYSEYFGGPKALTDEQIDFIDNAEVESYRRKIAAGERKKNIVENRIAIVTGGSQGFGEGIVRDLFDKGCNIIIADIKDEKGKQVIEELAGKKQKNQIYFIKTDVSDDTSVENLIYETVKHFGGLDILISNAGILKAGGLEEMDPKTFEQITKVNYMGYFICSRHASQIMKQQHEFNQDFFMDIIQINSKSGLKGSKKNFAYAGGKFGGVGLTQSFALELMPYQIKVNSICPGNFFDGPLWSDPETGLFVQYLRTGKVPGAKSIEDVKKHYESQVPAGRGCRVEDVMKAIMYVIDQKYETGQAVPVTGGQNMLK